MAIMSSWRRVVVMSATRTQLCGHRKCRRVTPSQMDEISPLFPVVRRQRRRVTPSITDHTGPPPDAPLSQFCARCVAAPARSRRVTIEMVRPKFGALPPVLSMTWASKPARDIGHQPWPFRLEPSQQRSEPETPPIVHVDSAGGRAHPPESHRHPCGGASEPAFVVEPNDTLHNRCTAYPQISPKQRNPFCIPCIDLEWPLLERRSDLRHWPNSRPSNHESIAPFPQLPTAPAPTVTWITI